MGLRETLNKIKCPALNAWIVVLAVTLAVSLSGCAAVEEMLTGGDASAEEAATMTASGFIEGDEVTVAPETGGRIAEILVDRGARVEAGEVVVRLDDATLRSQRAEAEAALAAAEANLALVRAGARREEIAAARADLDEATAQQTAAAQAVINAREAITNPQELDAQIADARSQVALAEQGVEQAEADLAATQLKYNVYSERGGDVKRMWDLQLEASRAALDQAKAQLNGAQATLGVLLAIRENPLERQAALHQAETEAAITEAQVEAMQAKLDELIAGPTPEEVAPAKAQVAEARAALQLTDVRIDQLTLQAPIDGVVNNRAAQVGETATIGRPLLTIVNLDEVTLVIYVPQSRIGEIRIGQPVSVTVDTFPDRVFVGEVAMIAGEAEFTPQNVQTDEERTNLVFAVDVVVPNPEHALKLGMPADAVVRP